MKDLVFGKRNVMELISKFSLQNLPAKNWSFQEVLVKKNPSLEIQEILKKVPSDIKITYVTRGDLDALLPGKNHQGIVLLKQKNTNKEKYKSLEDLLDLVSNTQSIILALDRIQDTGNLGNIFRTAECFGVKHILLPERDSAPITETVEKISSGALHYLNVYRVTNLMITLEKLKEKGYWIVATDENGQENWDNLPEPNKIVLVMGNEAKGVKRLVQDKSDFLVRIPLHGTISSLNVSVATGIALDRIVNR